MFACNLPLMRDNHPWIWATFVHWWATAGNDFLSIEIWIWSGELILWRFMLAFSSIIIIIRKVVKITANDDCILRNNFFVPHRVACENWFNELDTLSDYHIDMWIDKAAFSFSIDSTCFSKYLCFWWYLPKQPTRGPNAFEEKYRERRNTNERVAGAAVSFPAQFFLVRCQQRMCGSVWCWFRSFALTLSWFLFS